MSETCNHPQLQLLGGILHPSGKDYQCQQCHELLRVEVKPLEIIVTHGRPPLRRASREE
jgi:hypothetical protein